MKEQLAIEGGSPVRGTSLPFGVPCLGEEEIAEVTATLRSGWIGAGPKTQQLEFAAYVGCQYAVPSTPVLRACSRSHFDPA